MAVIRAVVGETPVCFAAKLTPAELGTANDVRKNVRRKRRRYSR